MAEKFVLTTLAQGVGEIILNRPAKRNAITGPIVHDLDTALQNLMADRSCTVIIIFINDFLEGSIQNVINSFDIIIQKVYGKFF